MDKTTRANPRYGTYGSERENDDRIDELRSKVAALKEVFLICITRALDYNRYRQRNRAAKCIFRSNEEWNGYCVGFDE